MGGDEVFRLIWERPEPDERRASAPLIRAQVVASAVGLADAEGLAAVSIRRVAAVLEVRPMRLYSHVPSKDDLLELMIDAVHGEIAHGAALRGPARALPGGEPAWRSDVRDLARATRDAVRRHPWAIDLLGGRPHLGPHALEVGEATAAALSRAPGRDDPQALRAAVGALNSYLLGALRREIGELRAGQASGLSTSQWRAALGPYLGRQLATGRLPTIEKLVRAPDPDAGTVFTTGLALVLDGLARVPGA